MGGKMGQRALEELNSWKYDSPLSNDGVIVGCTKSQEWLLPWWWMNYSLKNLYPVTFFDFGDMTPEAKAWCAKRGTLEPLNIPTADFVAPRDQVPAQMAALWEQHLNLDVWSARLQWFKKPFACLHSPYQRTIWIDLDCQVRMNLAELFSFCENPYGIAVSPEPPVVLSLHIQAGNILSDEIEYNTGVVVFRHGSDVVNGWVKYSIARNSILRGDQETLSRYVFESGEDLPEFPEKYNARWDNGFGKDTAIIHWLGTGKGVIKEELGVLSNQLLIDLSF